MALEAGDWGRVKCSTPEGIIEGSAVGAELLVIKPGKCSTPEGIIEGSALETGFLFLTLNVCSTPEGIIEGSACAGRGPAWGSSRAQRPKAS